jgi:hypothetical protein
MPAKTCPAFEKQSNKFVINKPPAMGVNHRNRLHPVKVDGILTMPILYHRGIFSPVQEKSTNPVKP